MGFTGKGNSSGPVLAMERRPTPRPDSGAHGDPSNVLLVPVQFSKSLPTPTSAQRSLMLSVRECNTPLTLAL